MIGAFRKRRNRFPDQKNSADTPRYGGQAIVFKGTKDTAGYWGNVISPGYIVLAR